MSFIGRFFLLVLFLSFGEFYLLVYVSEHIGILITLSLCVLTGLLGGAMVRYQGLNTWSRIKRSLASARMPSREIASGLILIVIGTLMLTPGFITDTVAFLLLVPVFRGWAASRLLVYFKDRMVIRAPGFKPAADPKKNEDVVIEVDGVETD